MGNLWVEHDCVGSTILNNPELLYVICSNGTQLKIVIIIVEDGVNIRCDLGA